MDAISRMMLRGARKNIRAAGADMEKIIAAYRRAATLARRAVDAEARQQAEAVASRLWELIPKDTQIDLCIEGWLT